MWKCEAGDVLYVNGNTSITNNMKKFDLGCENCELIKMLKKD